MRFEVVRTIYNRALQDKSIYFITGDLEHIHAEAFRKNLPKQYINAGIAEQNIIGIAAGLALSGNKVFVYSIAPFITMRCYEQIRVDVCYQNLNVTVIGVGGGFAYSTSGCTHYAIEDIAIMRALPNMHIFSPSNPLEARLIAEYLVTTSHPAYLRIGRGGEPMPTQEYPIQIGKGLIMKAGNDITIFSTGTITQEALKAACILEGLDISVEVVNLHTIKPLDEKMIQDRGKEKKAIFVLEEHNVMGGLGEAIARVLCEAGLGDILFKCLAVTDQYPNAVGSQNYIRGLYGLSSESIAERIVESYRG